MAASMFSAFPTKEEALDLLSNFTSMNLEGQLGGLDTVV